MATLTPEQRALFEGKNWVAIATLGKDGTPRCTVVWVDVDDTHVLVNGASKRGWINNVRRNPHVALTIYDHDHPPRRVSIVGVADAVTTEGADEHFDRLMRKYNGRGFTNPDPANPRVLVRIRPERINSQNL